VIDGPAATIDDFLALSAMVRDLPEKNAGWFHILQHAMA